MLQQGSIILGVMSFLLAWIVAGFFSNVLLNIVDVVFMCYAMDRDTQVGGCQAASDVLSRSGARGLQMRRLMQIIHVSGCLSLETHPLAHVISNVC